jgi:hypothetical protein
MANEGWVVEEVEDAENQGIPQPATGTTRRWLGLFGSQNLRQELGHDHGLP